MEIPPTEQAQMLAEVRRARYGYLLALHILLLCAAQRSPTEIAAILFCSRSTVYRVVQAYRAGQWEGVAEEEGATEHSPRRRTLLAPSLTRSLLGILYKVAQWLAAHPRFELLYLPTYCPRANPIERAFGDVHDKCTRNHTRKQMWQLVQDVKQHLLGNGPWRYALSHLYYTPEVTAAVDI